MPMTIKEGARTLKARHLQADHGSARESEIRPKSKKMLRIKELTARVGLSRSSIYSKLDPGSAAFDPTFPKQIKLGSRAVAWLEDEVEAWLDQLASHRS